MTYNSHIERREALGDVPMIKAIDYYHYEIAKVLNDLNSPLQR